MDLKNVTDCLSENNYSHIHNFSDFIDFSDEQEAAFKNHWGNLKLDYNFSEYTYRERRILRYHYQHEKPLTINFDTEYKSSVVYDIKYTQGANQLTYVDDALIANPLMEKIITMDLAILKDKLNKNKLYSIDIHLFRVKTEFGKISPTTSGIHKDGVDFICMHFINSYNAEPVYSRLYRDNQEDSIVFRKVMNQFLEVLIVNDKVLYHSADPIKQLLIDKLAFRDLLLLTCRGIDK